jgi:hypothetical protein
MPARALAPLLRTSHHKANPPLLLSPGGRRVAVVSFDHQGQEWYCVTAGRPLFEAVRSAAVSSPDPARSPFHELSLR